MHELIENLGYNDRTKGQIESAIPAHVQVYDLLDVIGKDGSGMTYDGVIVVTDGGLLFVKTRLFGKPAVDRVGWTELRGFEVAPGVSLLLLETNQGRWMLGAGASMYGGRMSKDEREAKQTARLEQLVRKMKEASARAVQA